MKCTGVKHSLSWTEPTRNTDGTLITNLSHSYLYYQVNNNTPVKKKYTARKATGGTKRTGIITTPIDCGTPNRIKVWIEHIDLTGKASKSSPIKELDTTWHKAVNPNGIVF